jgi:hypothetical protein
MINSLGKKFPKICLGCCGTSGLEVHELFLSHTKDEFPATRVQYSILGSAHLCNACKEKSKKNRKLFFILGTILIALGFLSWVILTNWKYSFETGIGFLAIGGFFIYKAAMLVTLTSNYVKFVGVKKEKKSTIWTPKLKFANDQYRKEFENANLYGYQDDPIDETPIVNTLNDDGWGN